MSDELIYCFGVISEKDKDLMSEPGIFTIACDSLTVLARKVPGSEFGEQAIKKQLKSMEWLSAQIAAHDETLRKAMNKTTVIPWRFGAIFESEEGVKKLMSERQSEFQALLDNLKEKEEWTIQGKKDNETALIDHLRNSIPAIKELIEQERVAGKGTAYLLEKRQKLMEEDQTDLLLQNIANEASRKLEEIANLAPLQADQDKIFYRVAALIDRSSRQKLDKIIADLNKSTSQYGLSWLSLGPYPSYSFVGEECR